MWKLSLVSGLMLTNLCFGAPERRLQLTDNVDAIDDLFNTGDESPDGSLTTTGQPGNIGRLVKQVFHDDLNSIEQDNNPNDSSTIVQTIKLDNTGHTVKCICVPYYQCQNGTIIDNGVGLIDIRSGFPDGNTQATQLDPDSCENYLEVCCQPPDILSAENRATPPPVLRNGCGRRHENGVGFRITGDKNNEAQFGEFPWMVAILEKKMKYKQNSSEVHNIYRCGGALIHRRAVLTAAHCIIRKKPNQLIIRAGEWDTQIMTEIYPHQDRDVSKVVIHETFNPGTLKNDFAILILERPVDITENVDTVCLPQRDDRFDASRCFASGWGEDDFGEKGRYQVILKKVQLPVVPRDTCQNTLRNTRLGRYFILSSSFICAGGEPGRDTCKGDGGSPLVCPLRSNPLRYVQAGIVSWGIGCGNTGIPGVYANVAGTRGWIDATMANNNLNTISYTY